MSRGNSLGRRAGGEKLAAIHESSCVYRASLSSNARIGEFRADRTYGLPGQSGVKWARCHTGWPRTERVKGEYDFRWLEDVVDRLRAEGIRPWFCLGSGNKIYIPDATNQYAVGWHPLRTSEARQGWLRFTAAIAERFPGRVAHWGIWNEANGGGWWSPNRENPGEYVELLRITAPEIRKRVPGAVIVGGALARGRGPRRAGDSAFIEHQSDFLENCLELGLAEHVDRISYHPYRSVPEENFEDELRRFRALAGRYGKRIGIWQGECGCPSQNGGTGGLSDLDWNGTRRAKWLLRRLLTDNRLELELTSCFHALDLVNYFPTDRSPRPTNYKGVLRGSDYTPKPSYFALQSLSALFDSDTVPDSLPMLLFEGRKNPPDGGEEGVQKASFVRGGRPLHAYWYAADLQIRNSSGLRAAPAPRANSPWPLP